MNILRSQGEGYTITEVLIFLAVSAGLLVSALTVISGRQANQEFYQAVREADSRIRDVMNDFTTGIYPNINNLNCTATDSGGPPVPTAASGQQGERIGCTFIGKVIQFAPSGTNREGYKVITVVGRQFEGAPLSEVVKSLAGISGARPRGVISPSSPVDISENGLFGYGLRIESMTADIGGSEQPIGAIGFFSNFAEPGDSGLKSGAQKAQLVAIPSSNLNQTSADIGTQIQQIETRDPDDFATDFISRKVTICLARPGVNQHGIIRLGDDQRQITTSMSIEGGPCP